MAYDINLHPNQVFSPGQGNNPLVSPWSFDPKSKLEINYIIGSGAINPIDVTTHIKNYIESLDSNVYTNIKVFTVLLTPPNQTEWLVLTGELMTAMPGGYGVNSNNLDVTNTIGFQNLNLLTEGIYNTSISFTVTADSSITASNEIIEAIKYGVVLNVISQNNITLSPQDLIYSYERNAALPAAQDLIITTESNWTLSTDKKVKITGVGITDASTATQTIVTGSGIKTVQVDFNPELSEVTGELFAPTITVVNNEGYSDTINVIVHIFENVSFIFNPPSLSFIGIIGLQEATPLTFNVFGFGAFTLEAPSWLNLSASAGTNTGTFIATPFDTASMSEGDYEGNIVLTSGGDNYNLPVKYQVVGTVHSNLDNGNFNFTKDNEYLQVYNLNQGLSPEIYNIVNLNLIIKYYNYVTFLEESKTFNYILPFFNNSAKIHIGQIVERLLKKAQSTLDFGIVNLLSPAAILLPIYKPASVDANVKIINRDSESILFEKDIKNMQFVSGKKPYGHVNNKCILSNSHYTKRVTKNSIELLNFLIDIGFYAVKIHKNNDAPIDVSTESIGLNNVFRYKFNFNAYDPGDIIKIEISSGADIYTKTYQLIPEGENSNHIAFINQFNTLELMEFTGEWSISSDIKKISSSKYKDLVKTIENLASTKEMSLSINTGWVFKEGQILIDEIVRSKKAWLMIGDSQGVEIVPKNKKFINQNSEQALYEYQLDFEINRTNDVEVYAL